MTILQMKCFLKVCESKKYSEAAEKLGILQSSLFKQLKGIEDELLIKLFEKDKKGIKLTEAGVTLYPYIVFMYGEYEKMMDRLHQYSINERITLQLGSLYFSKPYNIFQMIREFSAVQPHIQISMDEYRSNDLEQRVKDGRLDAGFTYKELVENEFSQIIPIREDYLVAVMSKKHYLALKSSIKLSDLREESFVLMRGDEQIHRQLIQFCLEDGFVPREYPMDIRLETMKELIFLRNCVTILMKTMAESIMDDEHLVMVRIEGSKKLTLSLIAQNYTNACKLFANYISCL